MVSKQLGSLSLKEHNGLNGSYLWNFNKQIGLMSLFEMDTGVISTAEVDLGMIFITVIGNGLKMVW